MKYQVGDKVVQIQTDYFSNVYHFEKAFKFDVVRSATDRHFSCHNINLKEFWAGADAYKVYHQESGNCNGVSGRRWLHIEKDADEIAEMIEAGLEAEREKARKQKADEEARLDKQIEALKHRRKNVKTLAMDGLEKFTEHYETLKKKLS